MAEALQDAGNVRYIVLLGGADCRDGLGGSVLMDAGRLSDIGPIPGALGFDGDSAEGVFGRWRASCFPFGGLGWLHNLGVITSRGPVDGGIGGEKVFLCLPLPE